MQHGRIGAPARSPEESPEASPRIIVASRTNRTLHRRPPRFSEAVFELAPTVLSFRAPSA